MDKCNDYNQYADDVLNSEGILVRNKCFNGPEIYPPINTFNLNSYNKYKSKDYYSYINNNFQNYKFPDNYSDLTFEDICESTDYSLKPQQKFAGGIFNTHVENRGMLIYHGLGSGKTQTSIVIGEAFKFRNVKGTPIKGRQDTLVLVVVPASLTEQYFNEILGYVESGKVKSASGQILIHGERQYYLDQRTRNKITVLKKNIKEITKKIVANNSEQLKNQRLQFTKQLDSLYSEERKGIKRVYEIISHDKFLNALYRNDDARFIEGEYIKRLKNNNGLLIIDEAHRLVSAVGTSYRKLLFALKYHSSPLFRTILLTGSPIYDKPFEFGLLLNLLRPRIPFPDGHDAFNEFFLDKDTMINKELFRKMCSGYISYFKGGNPEAYPYKKITIMHHSMGPYQMGFYENALVKEVERDKGFGNKQGDFLIKFISSESKEDEVSSSVFNNSRLFCNIAFPEVTTGGTGSRSELSEMGLRQFRKNIQTEKPENILTMVEKYSSKFANVAKLVLKSEGPVFIYSNYVVYGVDPMAMVLDGLGIKPYPTPGVPNYFVWKGSSDADLVAKAKNVFNSIENKDGDIIKVILGTPSVMEGVDFKRVRQVHILDPWWNDSRMQQVMARAIRLCSHAGIPQNKRIVDVFIHLSVLGAGEPLYKIKIRKGTNPDGSPSFKESFSRLEPLSTIDPDRANWLFYESVIKVDKQGNLINITDMKSRVFKGSDILETKQVANPQLTRSIGSWKNLDTESVEQYMYSRALSKLFVNRQFDAVIKETSIDCSINKKGNIIRLDERYVPVRENIFNLYYENYSTGKKYLRMGIKSAFNKTLPENFLTIDDILENTAKNSSNYDFKDFDSGIITTIDKKLVVPEDIDCEKGLIDYNFTDIPEKIIDLTLNKELIPYLMKIDINLLKAFIDDVEKGNVEISDPKRIIPEIKKFYSKGVLSEKEKIISKLKELGIGDPDTPWELETPDNLKKLYSALFNKKK